MTHRSAFLLLLTAIALTTLPLSAHAQLAKSVLRPKTAVAVDKAVLGEMKRQKIVGAAIGILRKGKIVYFKGYGLANREKRLPVTTNSVFNWASNSKPILALLAMLLFGEGKLSLAADVRRYVPEVQKTKQIIKVRHLLCHLSGMPHYGPHVSAKKQRYRKNLPFLDPIVALDKLSRFKLQHRPGAEFLYSSYAYVLLSAVVQRAGKQPLATQIAQRITGPLKMKSFQLDVPYRGQAHWVVGYKKEKDKIVPAPECAHYWKHGAGAYKSNIVDFARWAQALLNGSLTGKKIENIMWREQKNKNGDLIGYGLGFRISTKGGRLQVAHNGRQPETRTRMELYPRERRGIVVMMNSSYASPDLLVDAIENALTGNKTKKRK